MGLPHGLYLGKLPWGSVPLSDWQSHREQVTQGLSKPMALFRAVLNVSVFSQSCFMNHLFEVIRALFGLSFLYVDEYELECISSNKSVFCMCVCFASEFSV